MKLFFEDLNISDLVRESVVAFEGAANSKQIDLGINLDDQEMIVYCDRDRLSQVMANLLSNAIKFTQDGGRVEIKAEKIKEAQGPSVMVSVSDTGPGIPEDMQAVLFDKFQQADRLVRDKEQGSGLGLALVREIIEHHEGSVGVDSVLGKGSNFYFILKLKGVDND